MMSSDASFSPPCYLAYTKRRQEYIAEQNLLQQRFEVYLNLYNKVKKTEQSPIAVFEPMFPRYIFFRPGYSGQSISVVRSTKGINNLAYFGIQPATLDTELFDRIRQLDQLRNQATVQEIDNLKAGEKGDPQKQRLQRTRRHRAKRLQQTRRGFA